MQTAEQILNGMGQNIDDSGVWVPYPCVLDAMEQYANQFKIASIDKSDRINERMKDVIEKFIALERIIGYPDDVSEQHLYEAQAINSVLNLAKEVISNV